MPTLARTTTGEQPRQFIETVWDMASVENDVPLRDEVKATMDRMAESGPIPAGYFRVVDLVNPASAYWSRTAHVPEPPDIAQKLNAGKVKHRRAGYWMEDLPDFVLGEGRIDGGYVGLSGVVGKLDFLLDHSVLEYKTKPAAPESPEEVWTLYPQDVEQTLFYAAMLKEVSDEHYLVFDQDSLLRCFRLKVRNKGAVQNFLRNRMKTLASALEARDPIPLGRCRYFEPGCKFSRASVCSCASLPELDTSSLRRNVDLERDLELERRLTAVHATAAPPPEEIWWSDIMAPRRRFLNDSPEFSQPVWKYAGRWLVEEAVRGTKILRVNPGEFATLRAKADAIGVRVPGGLLLACRSGQPDGVEVIPYIARASGGKVRDSKRLASYYVAELAVACGVYGSRRGVVFVLYALDGSELRAYTVNFRDPQELCRMIEARVRSIRKAEQESNPLLADECPPFMREGCATDCLCRPAPTQGVSR